jgi:hypothetical protein
MPSAKERVAELLQEAITILQSEDIREPTKLQVVPDEDEITLTGRIGRPEYKEVKGIPLFEAGLGIRRIDGKVEWANIQAWRNAAIWANVNLSRGAIVSATGKWKTNTWTTTDGALKEREVFVVTSFELGDDPL